MTQYERAVPYEGSEPYIFVSYSHKDTDRVLPVICAMKEAGYRIWYDEGIDPGSEWPESIAQHLANAAVCMFFLSANSLASKNCRREINFAISHDLGFLSVVLEDAKISLGLELQISSYMFLQRYKYRSEEQFLRKLMDVELLQPCRDVPEVIETTPSEPSPAPEKTKKPKAKKTRKSSGKKPAWRIGLVIAALVIGLFVWHPWTSGSDGVKVTIDDTEYRIYSQAHIKEASIDVQDIQKLERIEKMSSLIFSDCTFESGSLEELNNITQLNTVEMHHCTNVNTLAFANAMTNLHTLQITECAINDSILSSVQFSEKMKTIDLSGNSLTLLPDLSACVNLASLNIRNNQITSLDPMAACTNLKELMIDNNPISDISLLEPMIRLTTVDLSGTQITSLDGLKNCTVLETVDFSGLPLTDLSLLEKNKETLLYAVLQRMPDTDFSALQGCTNLRELYLTSSGVQDLSFVSGMERLERLQAADNAIRDLSPLAGCTKLRILNLAGNSIESLAGLPAVLETSAFHLLLQNNPLTSLEGLPDAAQYDALLLQNDPLADISALDGKDIFTIVLDYKDGMDPALLKQSVRVYVTSLDLSKQLALEEALGSRLYLVSEEEALEKLKQDYPNVSYILP
ncbi:MAG: leucine-rich repeat domain-containing protein [Solobacterium sp.]|nr:leucine-rich repeat domain-containing protein [Solobacterium sp.]